MHIHREVWELLIDCPYQQSAGSYHITVWQSHLLFKVALKKKYIVYFATYRALLSSLSGRFFVKEGHI